MHELVITPRVPLRKGKTFVVRVEYKGAPTEVIDPDESSEGWVLTEDGAFVVNEPQGSPGWYAANDNPRDKATYDMSITVPKGITAIGNGRLISKRDHGGKTTWKWYEDSPMAPYLATATNGVFELRVSKVGKIPLYQAADPTEIPNGAFERLAAEAEIIRFFSDLYGPYPFSSGRRRGRQRAGGRLRARVADQVDVRQHAEPADRGARGLAPVVRRRGDAEGVAGHLAGRGLRAVLRVDLHREARRGDRAGGVRRRLRDTGGRRDLDHRARRRRRSRVPVQRHGVRPRRATLQALRAKVGDRTFFRILRDWFAQNKYGNVTTADFVRLAEKRSRMQLDNFFDVWLYQPTKPTSW